MRLPTPPEGYYWRLKASLIPDWDKIQLVSHHWIFTRVHGGFYADTLRPESQASQVLKRVGDPSKRDEYQAAIYEANTRRNQPLLKPNKKGQNPWQKL